MEIGDVIKISKKKKNSQEDPGILARCPSTYGYMDMQFAPNPEYTYIIEDKHICNEYEIYSLKCIETPETRIGFELIYACRNMKWYVRISQVGYELEEAVVHRKTLKNT